VLKFGEFTLHITKIWCRILVNGGMSTLSEQNFGFFEIDPSPDFGVKVW